MQNKKGRSFLFKLVSNQIGFTLIEILVGAAMLGGLSLAVAQLMKNMSDDQAQGLARDDLRTLSNMIAGNLGNTQSCKDTVATPMTPANAPDTTTATGMRIPSILKSAGTPIYSINDKFGKLTIQDMKLKNYNNALKKAELEITVSFRKSSTISMTRVQIIPMNADINTVAGTVIQCASSVAGQDDLWKMMPIPLAGVFYNQGSALIGSGEADTGTSTPAMAFGTSNNVYAPNAIAVGLNNSVPANSLNGVALGSNNDVGGVNSVAIGSDNNVGTVAADGGSAIALGYSNFVNKRFGMALGYNHSISSEGGFALGNFNSVSGGNAFAIGTVASATGDYAVAIGNDITASGLRSVAIGLDAISAGQSSVSIGTSAYAQARDTVVIGSGALSTEYDSIAIGKAARTDKSRSIAIGPGTSTTTDRSIAIGDLATTTGDVGIAIGASSTTNGHAVAVGEQSRSGTYAVALGHQAVAADDSGIAIGKQASALGGAGALSAIAIGKQSQAMEPNSISIGDGSMAQRNNTVSIGVNANANGIESVSIGANSTSIVGASISLGANSSAIGNSIALGEGANANTNGIAIGNGADSNNNGLAIGPRVKNIVLDSGMIAYDGTFAASPAASGELSLSFKTVTICHQPAPGGVCPVGEKLASTIGGWVVVSDKNLKKDIKKLDNKKILENLLQLDISSWRYKSETKDSSLHLGPMAQDFYRLFVKPFNLDGDDKTLNPNMVTMLNTAGIQALDKKIKLLEKENTDLKSELQLMKESVCEINPLAKVCKR